MFGCNKIPATPTLQILLFTLILHQLPETAPEPSPSPILYDIYPFIRVYTNGTVQRFIGQGFSPPSSDPISAVRSKDVQISPNPNLISARLYLPKLPNPRHKFPLLIYFHGGGFFTESAFSPTYHRHLTALASRAKVLVVSVNYRLAPEHPLPTAYEDSWRALKWSFHHYKGNGSDPWLNRHADFRHVYLGGDSAGGNIANRMAIRLGSSDPDPGVRVAGMFLNCPYFLGKGVGRNESSRAYAYVAAQMNKLWLHAYPNTSGTDDPFVNPGMDPELKRVACDRVLVYVAGNDWLKYRGWYYKRDLERSGWVGEIKVVEVEGESHVFNVVNPMSPKAVASLRVLANFLNRW